MNYNCFFKPAHFSEINSLDHQIQAAGVANRIIDEQGIPIFSAYPYTDKWHTIDVHGATTHKSIMLPPWHIEPKKPECDHTYEVMKSIRRLDGSSRYEKHQAKVINGYCEKCRKDVA